MPTLSGVLARVQKRILDAKELESEALASESQAAPTNANFSLANNYIISGLESAHSSLNSIDPVIVEALLRIKRPTILVFENYLQAARAEFIRDFSGVIPNLDNMAAINTLRQETVLHLEQVRDRANRALWGIWLLENRWVWFFLSWKFATLILLVGLVSVPILYTHHYAKPEGNLNKTEVVQRQIKSDVKKIAAAANTPHETGLDKTLKTTQTIKVVVTEAAATVGQISILLAAVQVLLSGGWRKAKT